MKETPDMRLIFLSCFLFLFVGVSAQLKQTPILTSRSVQKKNASARIQSKPPITLPFWDDFSFSDSKNYAHDSLWLYGESVWVNTGMGINPPTVKVATFDGLDSLGRPYNINQPLAKGVADKLVSRSIRMDLVDPANRDSVFFFFYYQYQGNGEPPDPGDEFSLWFKNDSTTWVKVWSDTTRTHDNTKFVPVMFFITDSHFFHSDFQFRFQNFARLSGPFDNWNLDYVYISNGARQQPFYDTADHTHSHPIYVKKFPDRAIATPMTALLQQYYSVPVKHLLSKGDSLLGHPSLTLMNLREDQITGVGQPTNLKATLKTTTRLNKSITQDTLTLFRIGENMLYNTIVTVPFPVLPSFKSFDSRIDSIALKFSFKLNSSDNVVKNTVNNGDYIFNIYNPIDFRHNDTTSTNFVFRDYYAYDDGIAEYAATLTSAGNALAYEFDMMYSKADTLIAVDFYFPHVGDESNQVLQLMIFQNELVDFTKNLLTQQDVTVSRTENNQFTRVKLNEAVVVNQIFFIAYKQNANANIGIGLDKNSNSGTKISTNFGTGWTSSDLYGNLMIRPVFGNTSHVKGPLTAVEEKKLFAYPNPNHGIFNFPQSAQSLSIVDIAGRSISFVQEDSFESTRVILNNPVPGIYLVRYFNGVKWQTEKIMVLP